MTTGGPNPSGLSLDLAGRLREGADTLARVIRRAPADSGVHVGDVKLNRASVLRVRIVPDLAGDGESWERDQHGKGS